MKSHKSTRRSDLKLIAHTSQTRALISRLISGEYVSSALGRWQLLQSLIATGRKSSFKQKRFSRTRARQRTSVSGTVWRVLFGNHHVPATFQRRLIHESLEGRRLLTVNDLVITGTSGNDTLVVTATGADSGSYSLNGAVSVSFSGLTRLTFNAGSGNDTLTINNPAGALLAPSGGIDYNGGGNTGDALNLLGGGGVGVTQTYFVGATTPSIGSGPGSNGDGLIRFTGTSAVDIRFTGLAPIVDTVAAASLTVNATDAANTISITNGTVPRLIVAVDAFEPIEFDNKGLLVVNGGDGVAGGDVADNILLNFSNLPVGLTGITINADDGVDAVSLQSSANVAVTINGGAGLDVISVGNSGTTGNPGLLTPVAGPVIVDGGAGGASLIVDGSGSSGAASYTVTSSSITRSSPVGFGGVSYSNLNTLQLATGSGPDTVTVLSTSVPTTIDANADIDTLILSPTNSVTVFEQAGNYAFDLGNPGDLIAVDFENIVLLPGNGVLNILGDEGQGTNVGGAGVDEADRVEVFGSARNAGALRLAHLGSFVANPSVVQFTGVTTLNISTFDRDDDITIDPFASTTQAWNIALNVDSGSGDDDLVYGNASAIAVVDPVPNGSVAGVSENVTVTPTLIAGTGEIAVPGVVTIHFANTEDLSFLFNTGVSGDSDTLTMRSLDANASDVFTIRPDAAANDAEPVVDFDVNATQNLQLERVVQVAPGGASSPVSSLSFVGLSASDAFDLIPSANGTVLNIDGGNPTVNPLASDIVVVAAPANPNNLVAFQVGATNDQGTFLSNLAGTPRAMVNFARVEGLTINNGSNTSLLGSNSDNAISLVGTSANTLSAAIDAGPTILVNSVSTLNVNSLAGDDKIELTLGLLAINSISISGGAPTASDTIVLNGTGASDTIVVDQLTQDGGRVTGLGTPVTVATTEKLILNGVGGVDRLTLQTPANRQLISVTPGSTADQAYVSMRNLATNGGGSLLPIEYRNLGLDTFGTAQLSFSDISGNRVDDLTIEGLSTSDNFSVDSNGNVFLDSEAVAGSLQRLVKVATPGISSLNLHGHDGDDDFFVPGNHPFTGGISLDGGNPSASDTLIFAGSGGAITMNFASSTISETGFGPITTVGVEHVNISASTGNVNIAATTGNDLVEVIPGSNTATVRLLGSVPGIGSPPEVNASQIGTLNIDLGAGLDELTVKGSTGADSIAVTGTSVTIGLFEAVNFTGAEALSVLGQQGTDTFTVTSGTFPIFIDGGDPIGIDPGDSMTVSGGLGFFPGPESDEGGIPTAGGTISFDHLEQVAISSVAGCAFLLQGTNGDDDITVTAIDSTTTAGADGIQDFTVSLNADLSIFVLNQPDLYIDSMSGDDDIVIRAGAPNGADWDVYVRIAGGSPSIGAPLEADRLVLETPNQLAGFDNLVFTPTGSDTATLIIDENASGTYEAAGTDSQIAIGSFVFSCTMASYTYTSTAGGVELIQYNGEGAPGIDDNILINGTALDDTTIVNPTGIGSGTFTSGASPLFQFQSFDNLTVNPGTGGFDRVEINATAGADVVTSNASTIMLGGAVTLGQGIDQLDINTFDGNDNVDLNLQLTGLRKVIRLGEGDDIADLAGVIADSSDPLIYGGDGDDSIVGSPNIDNIYGGSGTDVILGLAGNDYIDGGDGNDTLTGGPGNDMLHGGSGGDVIIWNNGDNTDVVEGGTGDDLAVVNGAGAGDTFTVFANVANPSRLAVNRTNLIAFSLDIGDVEELDINSGSGADNVTVGDLSTTALRDLDLDLGVEAGVADTATVNGRTTADNIQMTGASNTMTIAGLRYDVRIINALASDNDDFTFNANAGDDQVVAADSVAAFFASSDVLANNRFRILGGDGNDNLSGYGLLGGQAGDDLLVGSLSIAAAGGNQVLQGGDGDDTMVGGTGNDTFDGGPGEDTILVRGTPGNDNIDIFQAAAATLIETVNGVSETDTLVLLAGVRTVERVLVQAGDGNDTVRVQWADSLGVDGQINSLFVQVDGGPGATGDRLGVVDLGVGDLLLLEQGNTSDKGTITVGPGNAEPLVAAYINVETSQPIPAAGGDVVVFKHDPFEFNNLRTSATYLGANSSINVDPTINPGLDPVFGFPADEDWYRVVAEKTGVLDFQVYFRQVVVLPSGRPGLPGGGNLEISVTDAAGNIISGFGANDATSDERFRIPAVQGQTYFLRVFANGASVNVYDITVMNYAPPVVRDIELLDNPVGDGLNSDTGRSQFDNTTRDNTPTLVFRLDDGILLNDIQGNSPSGNNPPNGVVIPIPFQASADLAGYRIAIFDEGSSPAPGTQVGTAPQVPLGFATFVSPGVYQFTVPNALSDGSHFLTARVQIVDPSNPQQTGFGERSVPLEIVVDTVVPLGFFGENSLGDTTQGLAAASDSGVVGVPFTFTDRVTNDTTPTFYGMSEANTIVRLYVETNGVPGLQTSGASTDLFLGLTVAVPLDGSNQAPGGQWFFTTPLDLNNPALGFTKDGLRSVYVTSEDLAGNTTPDASADKLNIFLDTAGAQVTDVKVTGSPLFNLFGLKPDNATEGPTPRVDGLTIQIQDFPNRSNVDPNFLYAALQQSVAETPGNFVLQGDQSGIIAIKAIRFIGNPAINGQRASGRIELDFYAPLPDDRFTLTIKDTVVDPVGNKLDGESNAAEPNGQPNFASGDGQPGRDFIARFTVDSRPEIGTVSQGLVYVDINGNFDWDPTGSDNDATNRDFVMQMGTITDAHFAGNFAPAGAAAASGYDKLGVYGSFNGIYSFLIDTNDDGVGDFSSAMPPAYQVNGIPVAGNFSAAHPGDEIGLFTGTFWYLDFNGNNQIDLGERIASNFNGLPVVGNFDNDSEDELATYDNATNTFHFDLNRDGIRDVSWDVRDTLLRFGGLSGFTDRPVAGDLNLDGIDDLGLWVKGRAGQLPSNAGEFFFWVSDRVAASPLNVFDAFSPEPLGNDLFAQFGDENALPIFGNFDPPVGAPALPPVAVNYLHNLNNPLDVNRDGGVSPLDVLLIVNALNSDEDLSLGQSIRSAAGFDYRKLDTNDSGFVSAVDALVIINQINRQRLAGEGEVGAEGLSANYAAQADAYLAQFNIEEMQLAKRRSRR